MHKLLVKNKLNSLYVRFAEKWMLHSKYADIHKNQGSNELSLSEQRVADAYRDCMDDVVDFMNNL